MSTPAAKIAELIKNNDNILVASHISPDGDAMGSSAAMGHILAALGKKFAIYNTSGMPDRFSWLPMPGALYTDVQRLPFKPKLLIALDCGDAARLGQNIVNLLKTTPSINIDHHLGNPNFGSIYNWVSPKFAAVGQMVADIAKKANVKLEGALAECVFTALSTDTGSFSFGNSSAKVFKLAAHLVENGLNVGLTNEKMNNIWSVPQMRLWSKLQENFKISDSGLIAYIVISPADIQACNAKNEDLSGFVSHLKLLRGIRTSMVLFIENKKQCSISLRSSGLLDIGRVAAMFGGGGHRNAAGALINMPANEALPKLLAALEQNLLDEDKN